MHQCHFGATEIDFLGRTITPEGVKPQKKRITNFLEKKEISEVEEGLTTLPWLPQLLQELHTKYIRNISSILPTPQRGREGPSDNKAKRTIPRDQQRPRQV